MNKDDAPSMDCQLNSVGEGQIHANDFFGWETSLVRNEILIKIKKKEDDDDDVSTCVWILRFS